MQQYRLSARGIRTLSRKSLQKSLMIALFALVAFFVMGPLNVNTGDLQVTPLLYTLPILLGLMIFGMYRNNKRLRDVLHSYHITVDQEFITREQGGQQLHIAFADISAVYEKQDGLLIVAGRTADELIVVMPELEGFAELKAILANIRPFFILPKEKFWQRYPIQATLGILTVMIIFYLSQNKILSAVTGIPLALAAGWGIFQLWQVRNAQHPLQRSKWALMVIMLCIIGSVVLKLAR